MKKLVLLAIESSCDETAAAVYTSEKGMCSSVLFSQTELHAKYGGVIPELASRSHIEKIAPIVTEALEKADIKLHDITTVAVTSKPGLPGSLLVGLCFAKSIAYACKTQLIGIDHLEGHIYSAHIENEIPFPYICLTASGGHTSLYYVEDFGKFTLLGTTKDDAAGEAFDKVAKLINLPYPGGPVIEKLAQQANFIDYFNYPRLKERGYSFSFSGLKTAVLYDLVKQGFYNLEKKEFLQPHNHELQKRVASSLLVCIKDIFKDRFTYAYKEHPHIKAFVFVGGVACNAYLKKELSDLATQYKLPFFTPSPRYCTDNAAMIAFVGQYKALQNTYSPLTLDIRQSA